MNDLELKKEDRVLVLGGTGFIGKRLVKELAGKNIKMRLLARAPSKAEGIVPEGADAEIIKGDLTDRKSLGTALKGIHSAYYLVHSMGGKSLLKNTEFAEKDKGAAHNFIIEESYLPWRIGRGRGRSFRSSEKPGRSCGYTLIREGRRNYPSRSCHYWCRGSII
jgi:nucleoside-diphosphate-sugar epimerase